MIYILIITYSILAGLLLGYFRMESYIHKHTRRMVKATGKCYMCADCPDGCPLEQPNDSRNK